MIRDPNLLMIEADFSYYRKNLSLSYSEYFAISRYMDRSTILAHRFKINGFDTFSKAD